jgi:rubrerythrin
VDARTGEEVDIMVSEKHIAIEYSAYYTHRILTHREKRDTEKLCRLARYYKVISLQEYDMEIDHPLIEIIVVPELKPSRRAMFEYELVIHSLLKKIGPEEKNYPNINLERDTLEILHQYVTRDVNDNFEEKHPSLAADWDAVKNGGLMPSMFKHAAGSYKFWWICRRCKHSYRMSMTNRSKVNPEKCPICARGGEDEKYTLGEAYPHVTLFWHWELNADHPNEILLHSEKIRIFRLTDERIVPVRVSNLSAALRKNPQLNIEAYLTEALHRNDNFAKRRPVKIANI